MTLSVKQERLKEEYIRARGYWTDWTEGMLRFSPGSLTSMPDTVATQHRTGRSPR
jgi:hypothetical protein